MHALLDNEVSQTEVNKITADSCNLFYAFVNKAGVCKEFRQKQRVNRTEKRHNTHVNKWFTNGSQMVLK